MRPSIFLTTKLELPIERQTALASAWVATALEQRRRMLQRKARDKKGVSVCLDRFQPILKRFDSRWPRQHPTSPGEVLGLYGSGMAAYWEQFPAICDYFDFDGGRSGNSILNQMLNFAYSLIDQQCLNLLLAHGFSPDIGILHTDSNLRNAPPLVRDLAIEYKFLAELVILKIVNRRQIALKDFSKKALNPTACNLIAAELEKKMKREIAYDAQGKCTYSLAMTLQMQLLRAYFLGQQEKYFPLAVK